MSLLFDLIAEGKPAGLEPWRRAAVTGDVWVRAAQLLAAGDLTMLSMWAEPKLVHLALLDAAVREIAVLSLGAENGRYPSIGAHHLPARRFERAISDLHGLIADGAPDARPWLDHGKWSARAPSDTYRFLPVEGEALHQIPVGPVHAGIIEPGHFRFTAHGETVVRLEERLGYVHKGIESLLAGASVEKAAKLAGRASGDSTVAYALAFAQALEAACGLAVSARAQVLRSLMLELERIANHLGDIGAVCNDAAFALMHAHCAVLRERVLRASAEAFGHRLMMDCVIPGGVRTNLSKDGIAAIRRLISEIHHRYPALATLYEETASLQDRTVGTGFVSADLARQFGAGGFVGRASARAFDARKLFPQPPYDSLLFAAPVVEGGDVDARVRVRMAEVEQSIVIIEQLLEHIPRGELTVPLAFRDTEGAALVEGFRGDIFAWVRVAADGAITRAHLRDPSWFQWPLLEAAIEGNIVADFPLCNKSFNCSYAGHDL
jgi:Ni,Fe-hydrogenase III large subunit